MVAVSQDTGSYRLCLSHVTTIAIQIVSNNQRMISPSVTPHRLIAPPITS